jgi:hypothetical protein
LPSPRSQQILTDDSSVRIEERIDAAPPSTSSPAPSPVTGMAATPDGAGYLVVNALGDVTVFGAVVNCGSTAGMALNATTVGIVATPPSFGLRGHCIRLRGGVDPAHAPAFVTHGA